MWMTTEMREVEEGTQQTLPKSCLARPTEQSFGEVQWSASEPLGMYSTSSACQVSSQTPILSFVL